MPRRCFVCLGLVFVLAGGALAADVEPPRKGSSDYYPLAVGSAWTYDANGEEIQVKVVKREKVGGVLCARLETIVKGEVVSTEHVAVQKDGLYRYTTNGQAITPPLRFLKLPCKKGDTWKADCKVSDQAVAVEFALDEGEVKVPAGKYKAVIARTTKAKVSGVEMKMAAWYARGVGVVRTTVTVGGQEVTAELKKFTPAK
jgi:hypothetical protein